MKYSHPNVQRHLHSQLNSRDINPERLVFIPPGSINENLTYLSQADIYLESTYINDHHVSALALNLGLPVIAQTGTKPETRATASLLKSAGLSSLIASSPKKYHQIATNLTSNQEQLRALKQELSSKNFPFFSPEHTLSQYEKFLQQLSKKLPTH